MLKNLFKRKRPPRAMTAGEIRIARAVFGDSIDYARVKIYDRRILPGFLQKPGRAMAYLNRLSFPAASASEDFSRENGRRQSLFIHELAHVWQHQNRVLDTRREYLRALRKHGAKNIGRAYAYRLEIGRDLTDYGIEQQATMIQDFFLLAKFNDCASHRNARQNSVGENLAELYQSVLANFIKNPGYARR